MELIVSGPVAGLIEVTATRVVPKVLEFYVAGAASLEFHIRTHKKHAYIDTNQFFHVATGSGLLVK